MDHSFFVRDELRVNISERCSATAILDARYSLLARGETYRDDAAWSNEIAQRLLVRVRDCNA
jgi:hypothetical protein